MDNMNNNYKEPTPGEAVASLVLGICSIVFACSGPIGLVCAIVDLVLSGKLKKRLMEVPTMGKVGRTLGIIGLILAIFGIIFWIVWFVFIIMYGEWEYYY